MYTVHGHKPNGPQRRTNEVTRNCVWQTRQARSEQRGTNVRLVLLTDHGTEIESFDVEPYHVHMMKSGYLHPKGIAMLRDLRSALLRGRDVEDREKHLAQFAGKDFIVYVYGADVDVFPFTISVESGFRWEAEVTRLLDQQPGIDCIGVYKVNDARDGLDGPVVTLETPAKEARCTNCADHTMSEPAVVVLPDGMASCTECFISFFERHRNVYGADDYSALDPFRSLTPRRSGDIG